MTWKFKYRTNADDDDDIEDDQDIYYADDVDDDVMASIFDTDSSEADFLGFDGETPVFEKITVKFLDKNYWFWIQIMHASYYMKPELFNISWFTQYLFISWILRLENRFN